MTQAKIYIVAALLLMVGIPLHGHGALHGGIVVEHASLVKDGVNVLVDMKIDLDDLFLKKNARLLLTPMLAKEGAKALLKTNPRLLNLNELYLIAQTFPAGSDEFNEVFGIAVQLFPNDPLANLNAANIALTRNDTKSAAAFLGKAEGSAEAINARGVLAMLEGRLDQALVLLREAQRKGINKASENIRQIDYRIKNY